jgi:Arc/MetJ-type ribon-helix-helix transcriptional regulator
MVRPVKKEKAGFWCPGDVDEGIKSLVERGLYQDRSKAIVALLRNSLQTDKQLPGDLQKRVETLASYLQREPSVVVRQCVEGILEMIDSPEPIVPLVVEEVRLRQEHSQKPAKR